MLNGDCRRGHENILNPTYPCESSKYSGIRKYSFFAIYKKHTYKQIYTHAHTHTSSFPILMEIDFKGQNNGIRKKPDSYFA